ncbi:MAG: hypothetical protein JST43_14615 [Bacteroidetes bacterium]|nr:hypothetical protein [Bacteroidota bacterium]MBS1540378.1 hypothetical protein [Bacteroidota bacterium]
MKEVKPFSLRLLHSFCPSHLLEEIKGDFCARQALRQSLDLTIAYWHSGFGQGWRHLSEPEMEGAAGWRLPTAWCEERAGRHLCATIVGGSLSIAQLFLFNF